jgi:hypothetical protein
MVQVRDAKDVKERGWLSSLLLFILLKCDGAASRIGLSCGPRSGQLVNNELVPSLIADIQQCRNTALA